MKKQGLVYSTDRGRTCPSCGNATAHCTCTATQTAVPAGSKINIRRSIKGRGGKAVIVITGIPLPPDQLKTLAKELKRKCGCGGTVKNDAVEIQGEHLQTLFTELTGRGYRVIKTGG